LSEPIPQSSIYVELNILDDVGIGQVRKRADEPTAAHTLYNLIDKRHGHSSTAVTSNIQLSNWGRYLGDATVTAAILDRLAMQAIRIDIDGPSYRQSSGAALAKRLGTRSPKADHRDIETPP
jgi:DNA replication protein DnaC